MCAQSWDDDTAATVHLAIGHVVVYQAEQTIARVRRADHLLTAGEVDARTRLGRLRLEATLARLLHDFAARWCEGRGHTDQISR